VAYIPVKGDAKQPVYGRNRRIFVHYKPMRSHQGCRLKGRTPAQTLRENLGVEDLAPIVQEKEDQPEAAKIIFRNPGVG